MKASPAYHDLGDHSETVQVDFDPVQISYARLLEVFWKSHSPGYPPPSRQYASIIFYHNDDQRRLAEESKEQVQRTSRLPVLTEIVPFSAFYLAEAYHQKHYLRSVPFLLKEFRAVYPSDSDFINSTAAARVNGCVAGYATSNCLGDELDSLGLSLAAKRLVVEIARVLKGDMVMI